MLQKTLLIMRSMQTHIMQTDADTAKANFDDAVTNATTKLAKAKSDADTVFAVLEFERRCEEAS